MRTIRLALIGFGNVGQGFAQILHDQGQELIQKFGINLKIVAVCDLLKGSIYNSNGFTPSELLTTVQAGINLETLSTAQNIVHDEIGEKPQQYTGPKVMDEVSGIEVGRPRHSRNIGNIIPFKNGHLAESRKSRYGHDQNEQATKRPVFVYPSASTGIRHSLFFLRSHDFLSTHEKFCRGRRNSGDGGNHHGLGQIIRLGHGILHRSQIRPSRPFFN